MRRLPALRGPFVLMLMSVVVTGVAAAATRDSRALARADAALAGARPKEAVAALQGRQIDGALAPFLLGTALLETGRPAEAAEALAVSIARSGGPEQRRRALYNLSVARLHLAARGGGDAEVHARGAAAAAGDALRLRPGDEGARWNLALAQRMLAGDGAADEPQRGAPSDGQGRDGGVPLSMGGVDRLPAMSQAEATRILDALRGAEGASLAQGAAGLLASDPLTLTRRGPPW